MLLIVFCNEIIKKTEEFKVIEEIHSKNKTIQYGLYQTLYPDKIIELSTKNNVNTVIMDTPYNIWNSECVGRHFKFCASNENYKVGFIFDNPVYRTGRGLKINRDFFGRDFFDENRHLINKLNYADLLNLLDKKEVFSYKTTNFATKSDKEVSNLFSSSATSLLKNSIVNNEDTAWIFNEFKETFYELVYKFPNIKYLKDSCVNNCVDYYLQRKLLPSYGTNNSVKGIKSLLEKYFLLQVNINSRPNVAIRKFVCDMLHKKLNYYLI